MFPKADLKTAAKLRDGRHCDLCGCSFPAVRCDKCSSQIFCLSCDDMYHRHPKRKFHLRKAVDPTPTPQARPVLPMKVSSLSAVPGDPSKMPLPPPRKKKPGKSIFDTFRRGNTASDTSPTFSKKDYSWSDRFGSIKKFMSNRPLPPVPDNTMESRSADNPALTQQHNLSFIHRRVDDKPPALPERSQSKPQSVSQFNEQAIEENKMGTTMNYSFPHRADFQQQNHMSRMTNGNAPTFVAGNGETGQQSIGPFQSNQQYKFANQMDMLRFGTLRRESHPQDARFSPVIDDKQCGMRQSSSVTDLTSASAVPPVPGMQPFVQYPYNPHLPPHYPHPYPMYPQYAPYPPYFGNSWANLNTPPPTTDGDLSDQSETSPSRFARGRHSSQKDKKAKRSQSVLMDRMALAGQYYPFGPFPPGYPPPWIPGLTNETPPSPTVSVRSVSRGSHSRRRKKTIDDDDDDDNFSSSPVSRPKSSSSEMSKKHLLRKTKSCPSSSSSEEIEEERHAKPKASPSAERKFTKHNFRHRSSSPHQSSISHKATCLSDGENYKHRYHSSQKVSKGRNIVAARASADESDDHRLDGVTEQLKNASVSGSSRKNSLEKDESTQWIPLNSWRCKHCTFINSSGERICQVCCRTATKSVSPVEEDQCEVKDGTNNESRTSSSPERPKQQEQLEKRNDGIDTPSSKHDIASLNSALDEAEKEINRSLEELLKVQDDCIPDDEEKSPVVQKPTFGKTSEKTSLASKERTPRSNQTGSDNKARSITTRTVNSSVTKDSHTSISYGDNIHTAALVPCPGSEQNIFPESLPNSEITAVSTDTTSVPSFVKEADMRKDSFCQTAEENVFANEAAIPASDPQHVDSNLKYPVDFADGAHVAGPYNGFGPLPQGREYRSGGMLYRSHSRASLFGGRLTDGGGASPLEYGALGVGYSQSPMVRSISRTSLLGDAEGWPSEYPGSRKPRFYLSMEELVERRRQETMRAQGLELVQMIREAEHQGFTADDIQVAVNNCGKQNPLNWLQDNWQNIIRTVVTLATNYGKDKRENDVGVVSENEARDALRLHKGNIWAAVTECVEGRQRKFLELSARGNFTFNEIVDALTTSEGDVEVAYSKLTKTTLQPFLMRIWGSGEGVPNLEGAMPGVQNSMLLENQQFAYSSKISASNESINNDGSSWSDGEYDDDDDDAIDWKGEETDGEEEQVTACGSVPENIVNMKRKDLGGGNLEMGNASIGDSLLTPESDKSDYCDAFGSGLGERYLSSTSIDEIYLIETEKETQGQNVRNEKSSKRKPSGILHKLAALRKNEKPAKIKSCETITDNSGAEPNVASVASDNDVTICEADAELTNKQISEESSGYSTSFHPLNILKQTFTAIKDTVTGSSAKTGKCNLQVVSQKRTIVVRDKIGQEVLPSETSTNEITLPHNVLQDENTSVEQSRKTIKDMDVARPNNSDERVLCVVPTPTESFDTHDVRNHIDSSDENLSVIDPEINAPNVSESYRGPADQSCSASGNNSEYHLRDEFVEKRAETVERESACKIKAPFKLTENEVSLISNTRFHNILAQHSDSNDVETSGILPNISQDESVRRHRKETDRYEEIKLSKQQQATNLSTCPDEKLKKDLPVSKSEPECVPVELNSLCDVSSPANCKQPIQSCSSLVIHSMREYSNTEAPFSNCSAVSPNLPDVKDSALNLSPAEEANASLKDLKYEQFPCETNDNITTHMQINCEEKSDEALLIERENASESTVSHSVDNERFATVAQKVPVVKDHLASNMESQQRVDVVSQKLEPLQEKAVEQKVFPASNYSEGSDNSSITKTNTTEAESQKATDGLGETSKRDIKRIIGTKTKLTRKEKTEGHVDVKEISAKIRSCESESKNESEVNVIDRDSKADTQCPKSPITHRPNSNDVENVSSRMSEPQTKQSETIDIQGNGAFCSIEENSNANGIVGGSLPVCAESLEPSKCVGNRKEHVPYASHVIATDLTESSLPFVKELSESHDKKTNKAVASIEPVEPKSAPEIISRSPVEHLNKEKLENIPEAKKIISNKKFQTVKKVFVKKSPEDPFSREYKDISCNPAKTDDTKISSVQKSVLNDLESASEFSATSNKAVATAKTNGSEVLLPMDSKQNLSKIKPIASAVSVNAGVNNASNDTGARISIEHTTNAVPLASDEHGSNQVPRTEFTSSALLGDVSVDREEHEPRCTEVDHKPLELPPSLNPGAKSGNKGIELDGESKSETFPNKKKTVLEGLTRVSDEDADLKNAPPRSNSDEMSSRKATDVHLNESQDKGADVGESESEEDNSSIVEQLQKNSNSDEKSNFHEPGLKKTDSSDDSSATAVEAPSYAYEALSNDAPVRSISPVRPSGTFRRMSFNTRREAIFQERNKDGALIETGETKPWFVPKKFEPVRPTLPKRSIKQQLEFERKVRKLVSERKCRTYRKAEIIVQLLDLNFQETDAVYAANECSTFEQALSFLQQECLLCAGKYPISEIISMVHCSHKACKGCIKAYFTIQIRDRTIMELLCPFCNEPDIADEDVAQDYFNHLDIMLKELVDVEIHELFQRKLRDRVLMRDPSFRWCLQCSSGFLADPNLRKLMCPDCHAIMCASCRKMWEREHEGVSCEAFAAWKDANDPEAQTIGLAKLLTEDGIDCPSCHFRYALAKGGCMHFKCIQCHHDFCSGCTRPFKMGQKCGISEFCVKLGLHAHHPRNCLFYLRDKEPEDLQKLLEMNDIEYNKEKPESMNNQSVCQVLEQKETSQGMIDDICGKDIQDGFAGLCRIHYVEYLGQLVNKHKIDPIQIFDNDDLELVLKRASIRLPPKRYRESCTEYREKLVQLIEEKLPLCEKEGS